MRPPIGQVLVVEFIGPVALTFIGAGSIVATGGQDLVAIALAHSLAIAVLVAAAGHISGGVYNPALAVAFAATRHLPWTRAIAYIIVECLGAIAGAFLLKAVVAPQAAAMVNLGNPALARDVDPPRGTLIEIVLTFFLTFVVFGTAIGTRGSSPIAGLVIGLTITMDILMGGNLTGAVMNPSRWIGTAVAQGDFANWWVYWVGPLVGALIAAFLSSAVLLDERRSVSQ